jgi:N-acyl-D-glutamate deacylase
VKIVNIAVTATLAAAFASPAQTSVGFEHVIVAGTPLVTDGVLDTEVLPGQAIRRGVE